MTSAHDNDIGNFEYGFGREHSAKPASPEPARLDEVIELLSIWAGYGTFKPNWSMVNLANDYLQIIAKHPTLSPDRLERLLYVAAQEKAEIPDFTQRIIGQCRDCQSWEYSKSESDWNSMVMGFCLMRREFVTQEYGCIDWQEKETKEGGGANE